MENHENSENPRPDLRPHLGPGQRAENVQHAIWLRLHREDRGEAGAITTLLKSRGFHPVHASGGSGLYLGHSALSSVEAIMAVQDIGRKGLWILSNLADVRLIRMRIEENISAIPVIDIRPTEPAGDEKEAHR